VSHPRGRGLSPSFGVRPQCDVELSPARISPPCRPLPNRALGGA